MPGGGFAGGVQRAGVGWEGQSGLASGGGFGGEQRPAAGSADLYQQSHSGGKGLGRRQQRCGGGVVGLKPMVGVEPALVRTVSYRRRAGFGCAVFFAGRRGFGGGTGGTGSAAADQAGGWRHPDLSRADIGKQDGADVRATDGGALQRWRDYAADGGEPAGGAVGRGIAA